MTAKEMQALVAALKEDADDGDSAAMFDLAVAYRDGKGVEMDLAESARWLVKAAEAGNENAKVAVAELRQTFGQ
jgi:TPR repeat protein